jgi:hypothetical protein
MNSRVEYPGNRTRTSRRASEVFAICDDDSARLEGACGHLRNRRNAVLIHFDCASAIDAAFKGVIDGLVVDGSASSSERLTALSFLHRERPRIRIYLAIYDGESAPRLQPWESVS